MSVCHLSHRVHLYPVHTRTGEPHALAALCGRAVWLVSFLDLDELRTRLAEDVPHHRWSALIDLSPPVTAVWTDGAFDLPVDALQSLPKLARPPPVPSSAEEIGGSVVCVSEREVQIYVRCRSHHFLGVGAQRPNNVGLVRSVVVRAARELDE